MRLGRVLRAVVLISIDLFLLCSLSFASDTTYFYDDLGRLIKVVSDTGEAAIYSYDEVGNIYSIETMQTDALPPVLSSINPEVVFIGTAADISISGNHLIATEEITSDNPGVVINTFASTDTAITANITISSGSALGPTNLKVETIFGRVSIPMIVAKLTFTPNLWITTPMLTKDISVIIAPALSKDLVLTLNNPNPEIISAPQAVTITAGGSATFAINALQEGTGAISAGNTGVSVYVTEPFSGDMETLTQGISVGIQQPPAAFEFGPLDSNNVSVNMTQTNTEDFGPLLSNPISVGVIENISEEYGPFISKNVSVGIWLIENNTPFISKNASIAVQANKVMEINPVVSRQMSVAVALGNKTSEMNPILSNPVSAYIQRNNATDFGPVISQAVSIRIGQ